MKRIEATWRSDFILGEKPKHCVFCKLMDAETGDPESQVLWHGDKVFLLMNKYPYIAGHLLAVPKLHISDLSELPAEVMRELADSIQLGTKALQECFKPDGINVGCNMGIAAGAGIPGHVHFHVLPRWIGDTNFMPVMSDVRVLSTDTQKVYEKLLPIFSKLT